MKKQKSRLQKVPDINKKKKVKSLPNKPVPLGGSPFVGRHTTG
jgi:hypothetical protein